MAIKREGAGRSESRESYRCYRRNGGCGSRDGRWCGCWGQDLVWAGGSEAKVQTDGRSPTATAGRVLRD